MLYYMIPVPKVMKGFKRGDKGKNMKNFKRIAAILGVVILLAVCCLPMIFAFGSGENSQGNFKAAVGMVILVPVLAYVFLMVYKLLKKRQRRQRVT